MRGKSETIENALFNNKFDLNKKKDCKMSSFSRGGFRTLERGWGGGGINKFTDS